MDRAQHIGIIFIFVTMYKFVENYYTKYGCNDFKSCILVIGSYQKFIYIWLGGRKASYFSFLYSFGLICFICFVSADSGFISF